MIYQKNNLSCLFCKISFLAGTTNFKKTFHLFSYLQLYYKMIILKYTVKTIYLLLRAGKKYSSIKYDLLLVGGACCQFYRRENCFIFLLPHGVEESKEEFCTND